MGILLVSKEYLINFLENEISSDREIYDRLIVYLEQNISNLINSTNDLAELMASAHKAKSGCKTFGADLLESKIEELEHSYKKKELKTHSKIVHDIEIIAQDSINEIKKIANLYFEEVKKSA